MSNLTLCIFHLILLGLKTQEQRDGLEMKTHGKNMEYKILVGTFQRLVYVEADEMILK
jgi:hypothetical protein